MTESARIANVPLTKLFSETVEPFNFILVTLDTVPMDGECLHNPVSVNRVTLVLAKPEVMTGPTEMAVYQI